MRIPEPVERGETRRRERFVDGRELAHPRVARRNLEGEGREAGEFERKTPLDETVHAIYLIVLPYANPLLLQHNLDVAEEAPAQLSNLVLRSLAP